ncbi:MAG: TonB-dependent receptor [Acidobacteriota bacterium]
MIEVRPSIRVSSSIGLRRPSTSAARAPTVAPVIASVPVKRASPPVPILNAGVGLPGVSLDPAGQKSAPSGADPVPNDVDGVSPGVSPGVPPGASQSADDHGELAWHLRHLRRSVLQDATNAAFSPDDSSLAEPSDFGRATGLSRSDVAPLRLASNLFSGAPLSGEFNFLTTSSFDTPQQLFNGDMFARSVAYVSVGAPTGGNADWAVKGALSQADISAWVIAGTYSNHGPARHHYDVGLSYATQRYDGGNPAALRDVTDGSRNAGAMYGFDTWTVSPALTVTYGARYARYDYLQDKGLLSPRLSMTLSAGDRFRVTTAASRRAIAPGAEEFLPPGDAGIWLPPQRTFSSLAKDGPLDAERTTHVEVEVERDLGPAATVTIRAFQQYVADQLVTLFGVDMGGLPPTKLGHYFVGNDGDVDARGIAVGLRTVAHRFRGSVDYSMTRAEWKGGDDLNYLVLKMPGAPPLPDRLHSVSTSIQTDVPETSTRVVVLYRLSNAFARRSAQDDHTIDSRFDVEVHQSLPFLDFSTAKWEMLIGVRNFFREMAPDQSVFDELLVMHPPKRIVGGLTMRF